MAAEEEAEEEAEEDDFFFFLGIEEDEEELDEPVLSFGFFFGIIFLSGFLSEAAGGNIFPLLIFVPEEEEDIE